MERFRSTELANMRLEEKEKYQSEIENARKEVYILFTLKEDIFTKIYFCSLEKYKVGWIAKIYQSAKTKSFFRSPYS